MPFDPFAGGAEARDAMEAVKQRLANDPGLSDEEAKAIEVIVARANGPLAGQVGQAEKALKVADSLAGWIKDPGTLLSLIGL